MLSRGWQWLDVEAECGVSHGDSDLRFHERGDVTLAGNETTCNCNNF